MKIVMLVLDFRLDGCMSLKEKRGRLSGIRDRFGHQPNLAVCESDFHDSWKNAQWSFVAMAGDGTIVDATLEKVVLKIESEIDAQIVGSHREEL